MRALIVDDEKLARRGLELRLAPEPDIEICGQCANGRDAVEAVRILKPDLLFLDIQMPGMDGFEVIAALQAAELPMVVFVTAFDEYAIKAFEARALDYLLKPVEDARLHDTLRHLRAQFERREALAQREKLLGLIYELTGDPGVRLENLLARGARAGGGGYLARLPIRDGRKVTCVDTSDIDWVDAAGDYMCVHEQGRTHVFRGTMKALEEILDPGVFQRVHRSTIVNVGRVKELRAHMNGEYFLYLADGTELKLSRNYKHKIRRFTESE
ncbi:MAG TPA: LytTR family DNA-binding domain-containing protein [Gammaproteobacteria bacterium]|nr:LytTR family DNA-binding domain-containing protein [Gammaproteobacteria bacterium]